MTTLIECRGLGKRFGGVVALSGIDLDVRAGEVLGVIGPNGAGKSTLIGILTGFIRPSEGRVRLDGRDVTRRAPWRIARGGLRRTFQAVHAFPSLTLEQNVRLGAAAGTQAVKGDAWIELLLDWLGLPRSLRPDVLTAGQMRLLAVARAAAAAPRVLLLDEPAAGLSQTEAAAIGRLFARIRAESGATVVIVEHNMDFIFDQCMRIVTLDHGTLIADGTPRQIRRDSRVIDAYLGRGGRGQT